MTQSKTWFLRHRMRLRMSLLTPMMKLNKPSIVLPLLPTSPNKLSLILLILQCLSSLPQERSQPPRRRATATGQSVWSSTASALPTTSTAESTALARGAEMLEEIRNRSDSWPRNRFSWGIHSLSDPRLRTALMRTPFSNSTSISIRSIYSSRAKYCWRSQLSHLS